MQAAVSTPRRCGFGVARVVSWHMRRPDQGVRFTQVLTGCTTPGTVVIGGDIGDQRCCSLGRQDKVQLVNCICITTACRRRRAGRSCSDQDARRSPAAPDAERYTESMKAGHNGVGEFSRRGRHGDHCRHRSPTAASRGFVHVDVSGHARLLHWAGDRSFPLRISACRRFDREIDDGGACGGGSASECGFGVASMVS